MMATVLPDAAFDSWGWRLPFLASAALLVIGLYIRMSIVESLVVEQPAEKPKVAAAAKPTVLQRLRSPRGESHRCGSGGAVRVDQLG